MVQLKTETISLIRRKKAPQVFLRTCSIFFLTPPPCLLSPKFRLRLCEKEARISKVSWLGFCRLLWRTCYLGDFCCCCSFLLLLSPFLLLSFSSSHLSPSSFLPSPLPSSSFSSFIFQAETFCLAPIVHLGDYSSRSLSCYRTFQGCVSILISLSVGLNWYRRSSSALTTCCKC